MVTAAANDTAMATTQPPMQLVPRNDTFSLVPRNFSEATEFAKLIAASDLAPKDYRGKAGNVLIAVQMGQAVGLQPLQAIQNISVINGRPCLWGDGMLAVCRAHGAWRGMEETFDDGTMAARCVVRRANEPDSAVTFTQEDAKKAGLWGKQGPWQQYPKRMLVLRARAFALRNQFSDALMGFQSAEEVTDYEIKDARTGKATPGAKKPARVVDAASVVDAPAAPEPPPQPQAEPEVTEAKTVDDYIHEMESSDTEAELRAIGQAMNGHLENGNRERAVAAYKERLKELRQQAERAQPKLQEAPWDEEPSAPLTHDEAMDRAAVMARENEAAGTAKSREKWTRDASGNLTRDPGGDG